MYPASIQFSNDSFHQKHNYRQEYIAEDFNANTVAVRGSPRVCGDPVMTRSPIIHLANMRQSPRQTTDFILKAEKQKGVAYRELLANLYQHLLEKCLTAGAADMNRPNYCPVNSSTQVAGQFPSQAYLFVYIIYLQSLGQVSKSLETIYQSLRSS